MDVLRKFFDILLKPRQLTKINQSAGEEKAMNIHSVDGTLLYGSLCVFDH